MYVKNEVRSRRIYLVRHGEAGYTQPDEERTLSIYGQYQATTAACFISQKIDSRHLSKEVHRVLIRTSEYRRTKETAEVLANFIKKYFGEEQVEIIREIVPNLKPNGDYVAEADYLRYAADDLPMDVIVVSHMPFVAELAYELGDQIAGCFKNCEVAAEEEEIAPDGSSKSYRQLGHYIPDKEIERGHCF